MAINHTLDREEIEFVNYVYKNTKKNNLTVFDVGCNRGLYIDLFLGENIESEIHCFEPIVSLFNNLNNKYGNKKNIKLNNICLSDKNGEVTFHELTNPSTDGCSSIVERPVFKQRNWNYKSYEVKSKTIDSYCEENNINHIDYLKIDVEGAEFLVLKGCEKMLNKQTIDFIQFEYGNTFSDANVKLLDVYNLIKKYSYNIFLYKEGNFELVNLENIKEYSKIQICNFIIKK